VTVATDLTLLSLPDGLLDTLTRLSPSLSAAVAVATGVRLPG
jgi:hypothetical protein